MASPSMWKCAGCGAPNPMSRDACYSCQTNRFSDQTQAATVQPVIPDPGTPSQPSPNPPSDRGLYGYIIVCALCALMFSFWLASYGLLIPVLIIAPFVVGVYIVHLVIEAMHK